MHQKERGSAVLLRFMTWLSLVLGRRLTRFVVYVIAFYFFLAATSARRASRAYLQRCINRQANWLDVYRHVFAFAATIHDRIFLLNGKNNLFDVQVFGAEQFIARQQDKEGVLLFGAHLGSFEVLRFHAHHWSRRDVCAAMYPDNSRSINKSLADVDLQDNISIISLGTLGAMLAINEKIAAGATVALLADRAAGSDAYRSLPFLGASANFPTGSFRLAALLRRPVYFMVGLYRGGNRYDIHFDLLADFSAIDAPNQKQAVIDAITKYVDLLEHYCEIAPFNWFNFYDFWEKHEST
jgi:predicted LPLAT superfamily acyltransferase